MTQIVSKIAKSGGLGSNALLAVKTKAEEKCTRQSGQERQPMAGKALFHPIAH